MSKHSAKHQHDQLVNTTPFIQVNSHEGSPEGIRVSMEERICEMKEMSVKYGVKGRGSDM